MIQKETYRAKWEESLPEDEIGRQQQMKERLKPSMQVELRGLGRFVYSGTWDTMHSFYPAEGQNLPSLIEKGNPIYLKRDLAGRHFLQLPYTLLADEIIMT